MPFKAAIGLTHRSALAKSCLHRM